MKVDTNTFKNIVTKSFQVDKIEKNKFENKNNNDSNRLNNDSIVYVKFKDIIQFNSSSDVSYYCSKCSRIVTHHNVKINGVKYRFVEDSNCANRSSSSEVIELIENDIAPLSQGWVYNCD